MNEIQINRKQNITKAQHTAKIWLNKYNLTSVYKFSDCYPTETNKTLKTLIKSNLDKPTKHLLYEVLIKFAASFNLSNNFREDQIVDFIMDLFLYHSELTIRDIKLFLQQVKIGYYGQNFNRLDAPLLHSYLLIYKNSRLVTIEAENIAEKHNFNSNQNLNILDNKMIVEKLAPIFNKVQEDVKVKTEIQIKSENEIRLKRENQQAIQLKIHKDFCELHRMQGSEAGTMFVKYKDKNLNFEEYYNIIITE